MNTEDTVAVFTVRSPQRILREGGSQAWVLNPVRAKQCTWLVCVQNRHHVDHVFEDGTQPHGTAFLIGRISGFRRCDDGEGIERWHLSFSEYATIDLPDVWKGWRNPVRYTSLAELAVDPASLSFQSMPPVTEPPPQARPMAHPPAHQAPLPAARPTLPQATPGLTIGDAKRGLAAALGIPEAAVEITIRA